MPRLALYISAAISQWALAGLGLLIFLFSPLQCSLRRLPGASRPSPRLPGGCFGCACRWPAFAWALFLERRGWWPPEAELVHLLIPKTRQEKLWSVLLLAPTAALCEEFLYRGILLAQFSLWLRSGPWAWAVSSLAFGLAHIYQGWNGMLRASLLGALLAAPVVYYGSLYPSMLAHALIDALALAWLGPRFLRQVAVEEGDQRIDNREQAAE